MNWFWKRSSSRLSAFRAYVGAIGGVLFRGCGALLTLAIFTLTARGMSVDDFGRLAVWFNIINFLAILAVLGQETLITRSWGQYAGTDDAQAWGAYVFGWLVTVASVAVVAAVMIRVGPLLFPQSPRATFWAAAFFLVTQALLSYGAHACRMIVGFTVSETSRELVWRSIVIAVVVWDRLHSELKVEDVFVAAGICQLISLGLALYPILLAYRRRMSRELRFDEWELWLRRSWAMWQSAVVEAGGAYADVVLIGSIASAEEAGRYFVAARLAAVFLMVQGGLSTSIFGASSRLYFSGRIDELQRLLSMLVLVAIAALAPVLALLYAFGDRLLEIFGAHYVGAYPTMVVLATGTFIVAACGSASVVLLTTGRESLYSRVIAAASPARVVATAGLAWGFGAIGAAFGQVMINAPLAIWLTILCRRETGLDTSALGAISLLGERRDADAHTLGSK
jgi:O-antigen/teichoic acid export membrane protein